MDNLTIKHWYCPSCKLEDTTREILPHSRMHTCPKMFGMTTPMLEKGIRGEHVAIEREDYVNGEQVQFDDRGRPVMSIITKRDEGQDTTVFAPVAVGSHKEI